MSFQKCVCLYHRKNGMMEDCTVSRRPSQSSPLPKRRVIVESSVSSSESNNHRKKRKMTKLWSETNTDHFLDILLECKRGAGPVYNGKGVTSILLTHVVHELSKRTNTTYNVGQVKEKHKRMKTDWAAFRKLIETTGAGWNSADNTIDVPKEKWEDFRKCEHSGKFFKKGLKRCEDMNELWLGVEATGAFARSCNDAPLSSDGEQELLRREFHQEEGSSQTCEQRGKSSRKGKKHMRDDTTMSYSPYSRSQSGKNSSNSAMSGANSGNHSSESLISIKALAYKAIVDRYQSKAEETVWSLGRCLDEVNDMEELKDREGNIPHALLFKATELFEADKNREAFMHYPHRTRVWFIQKKCPVDDDVPVAK